MSRTCIPHLSLIFGGFLGNAAGLEIWQCGINLVPLSTGLDFTTDDALATTRVNAIIGNLPTLLAAPITAACKALVTAVADPFVSITYIKLNAFGSNTLQLNSPTVQTSFTAVGGGQSQPNGTPWSSAVVFEHRTNNRTRGFGSHGRLSLPAAMNIDRGSGRFTGVGTTNTIAAVTTAYGTFLAKLNLQQGTDTTWAMYPGILYGTDSSKVYKIGGKTRAPFASKVDSFYVSTIPGEIRRRQNKLARQVVLTTVTYGAVNA